MRVGLPRLPGSQTVRGKAGCPGEGLKLEVVGLGCHGFLRATVFTRAGAGYNLPFRRGGESLVLEGWECYVKDLGEGRLREEANNLGELSEVVYASGEFVATGL